MSKILVLLLATLTVTTAVPLLGVSRRLSSPFGIVEGIRDCGSRGKLGIVQVTDCTLVPCHFNPDSIYDIAIRFTAGLTSENLELVVFRMEDDSHGEQLLDVDINGVIEAGVEYELKFQLPITQEYAGTAFDIRFYILDRQNVVIEVCAEAAVSIGS